MKVKDLLRLIERESMSPEDEVVIGDAISVTHRPVLTAKWLNLEQHAFEDEMPVGFVCLTLGDPIHNDPAARRRE